MEHRTDHCRARFIDHAEPRFGAVGNVQLGKIDRLSVQMWVSSLSDKRSRATVAECKRLMSGVMRSAVKNRLIGIDPTLGVRVPGLRVRDTDERIVTREDVRQRLVPVVQPTSGVSCNKLAIGWI